MSVSLTTHVLDTGRGRPGSGVHVELRRGDDVIASAETDGDGRARLAEELEPGRYRLAFEPPSPYFRRVELELELDRIESLNDDPAFIRALAELVRARVEVPA